MAPYPLDAPLGPLCSDAERNAIQIRKVVAAHPHLRVFGATPEGLAAALDRAAAAGRAAHTARTLAHLACAEAADEAHAAARATYALQQELRAMAAALLVLDRGRWAAPVDELRSLLRLKAPRLRSGLDQLRHLRDHLARPDHPLLAYPAGIELRDRVVALEARFTRAVAARAETLRVRRARVQEAQAAREAVKRALREARGLWRLACARLPTLPSFHLEASARAVARPARADDPPDRAEEALAGGVDDVDGVDGVDTPAPEAAPAVDPGVEAAPGCDAPAGTTSPPGPLPGG